MEDGRTDIGTLPVMVAALTDLPVGTIAFVLGHTLELTFTAPPHETLNLSS